MIVAPTETMVRTVAVPEFLKWLPEGTVRRHNRNDKEIELINGYIMYYRSAELPDNLRGPNLDWLWVDEAAMLTEMAADILNARLRAKAYEGKIRFLLTTTPRGHNWLWKWFDDVEYQARAAHPDWFQLIRMKTRDNAPNLAEGTLEALESAYTGRWAKQELEGEFVAFEGLIWPQWDETIHLGEPPENTEFRTVVCGLDFGWTHPTVFEVLGLDWDGNVWLLHEYAQQHLGFDELVNVATELRNVYGVQSFACDHAAPDHIDSLTKAGLPANKANKDVRQGMRVVGSLLEPGLSEWPRLHVTPSALLLRKQIPSYVFQPVRGKVDVWHDVPVKEADDAPDALRYGCMALEDFLNTEGKRPGPKVHKHIYWNRKRRQSFQRIG